MRKINFIWDSGKLIFVVGMMIPIILICYIFKAIILVDFEYGL